MTWYNMQDEIQQLKSSSRLITLINIHDRRLTESGLSHKHVHTFDFHSSWLQRISPDWNCYSDRTYYQCLIVLLQRKSLPSHTPVYAELRQLCGRTVGELKSVEKCDISGGVDCRKTKRRATWSGLFSLFFGLLGPVHSTFNIHHCDSGRRHNRFSRPDSWLCTPASGFFRSLQSLLNILNGMELAN